MEIVRQHRVLVFFVLAYGLTWAAVPFDSFFAPGVLVAALVVAALAEGVAGVKDLGRRLIRWRVRGVWYLLAVGVPLLVQVMAVGGNMSLGAPSPSFDQLTPLSGLFLAAGMNAALGGPLSEELGFRGFALTRLQRSLSPLQATSILAVLVTGWHLPLFFISSFGLHPIDAVSTVAVTFWYCWLFNRADGSVLIVLIAHAVEGTLDANGWWTSGPAEPRQAWLYCAVWSMVAIALLVGDRAFWRRPARPEAIGGMPEPATRPTGSAAVRPG